MNDLLYVRKGALATNPQNGLGAGRDRRDNSGAERGGKSA
jgi:hypothetical protein